jgi:broad specificity phosphatase PhoE
MRVLALVLLLFPFTAFANEALWAQLEAGGQVILIRHTITTPGAGDPPGMRLDDCGTQRNLTEEGRAHARRIGEEFRRRKIPVERVLSSPWCRCLETARLAFAKAEVSTALNNLYGRYGNRERQIEEMKKLISAKRKGNVILVSHGSTILALTGVSPGTGGMVVVSADGKVLGRLDSE